MTHHDAPSGQPYSGPPIWERAGTLPPPTPPPFPNPGGGGDGGGGRKKHRKWPWAGGVLALIVVGGVAAGNAMSVSTFHLATCQDCEPIRPMPFGDEATRDEWARQHATIGHRVERSVEVRIEPDLSAFARIPRRPS